MKTKTSFTPGPWAYYEPHCKDGGWIMSDARAWDRQITGMFYGNPDERIANGHLIAAAPELLACLREVVFLTEGIAGLDEQQTTAINSARAAILKAEGSDE